MEPFGRFGVLDDAKGAAALWHGHEVFEELT